MGQDTKNLPEALKLQGAEATECGGGERCLRITYNPRWGWVGIYWWPTACEQEKDPWAAVESGACALDLRTDSSSQPIGRLTFAARGAKGGEKIIFGMGGDKLHPKKVQNEFTINAAWKVFEIDLRGVELKKVTGLFFFTASNLQNPSGFNVYIKDICYSKNQ